MARKTIIAIISTMMCAVDALGTNNLVEEVQLTNGTKLRGVISAQFIKKQTITVTSQESEIILPTNLILDQQRYKVSVKDLSEKWSTWTKEHPEYAVGGENITLTSLSLSSTAIAGMTLPDHFDSVLVVPSASNIKIFDFSEHKINVNLSTVELVKKIYSNNVSSKIREKIETRSNKNYTGRTLSQVPGKSIVFSSDQEGIISLNFTDISGLSYESTDPTTSINSLCEYEDIIEDVYGNRYEGVIIKKSYGDKNTPAFVLLKSVDKYEPEFIQNKNIQVIYKTLKKATDDKKTSEDKTSATNPADNTPSTPADTPSTPENKSYEEAVAASNSNPENAESTLSVEVNGFRCPAAKVTIKGSKYRMPMKDNILTFNNSDINGTIKISKVGGYLVKSEGGQTNELIMKMSEVSEKAISTSNNYTIGENDYQPEYKLEPGIYVYLIDGEYCIFIEIQ